MSFGALLAILSIGKVIKEVKAHRKKRKLLDESLLEVIKSANERIIKIPVVLAKRREFSTDP